MFVDKENNYNCYHILNDSNKCFCGKKLNSLEKDYCSECKLKKKRFLDSVCKNENFDLLDKKDFLYKAYSSFENIKQNYLRFRIEYMIDMYFVNHKNDQVFTEPYENIEFIKQVFLEKFEVLKSAFDSIITYDPTSELNLATITLASVLVVYKTMLQKEIDKTSKIIQKCYEKEENAITYLKRILN